MKYIFTILLFSLTLSLFSQDTTYYNADRIELNAIDSAFKCVVITKDETDSNIVFVKGYYPSWKIMYERKYNPYKDKTLQGLNKEWYENGQLKKEVIYKDGYITSDLFTYWDNGQLKRQDNYLNGEFVKGKVWDKEGKKVKYYNYEIMPEYPGGINGLFNYLGMKSTKYNLAGDPGVSGKVYATFTIEKDGQVSKVKILKGVNNEIDTKVIKMISEMPKWNPGTQDGEPVPVNYNLPININ